MTSKEVFKNMWLKGNTGDDDGYDWDDFNTIFANYSDDWFNDFIKFHTNFVETKSFMQHPDYTLEDIKNDLHPSLNTIIWNTSWTHADFCREIRKELTK